MTGRAIVIDVSALKDERRGPRQRAWWEECTDEEFREEFHRFTLDELESLISELNAAVSSTGTVVTNPTADGEWKRRARRALPRLTQRRAILAAEIRRRQNDIHSQQDDERSRIVADVRERALGGDVQGALIRLLDWVDGFGQHRRRARATERTQATSDDEQKGQ